MWTFLHTLSTSILGPEEDCHASEPRPRGKALPFFRGSQRASLESLHGCAYVSNTLTCEAFSTPKRQVYSLSVLRVRSHKGICRTAFLYVYVSVLGGCLQKISCIVSHSSQSGHIPSSMILNGSVLCFQALSRDFHNSNARIFL